MSIKFYLLAILTLNTAVCLSQNYINDGFEQDSTSISYTAENWKTQGFQNIPWTDGSERAIIDEERSHSGRKSLRVNYPAGGVGPQQTGHQAPCGLTPMDEYYLSYWLFFSEDFSWGSENQGGKLPGLSGGARCSGGETCDGRNGFTARYMWRENGRAVLYLYHMKKPGKYGEDYEFRNHSGEPVCFPKGEWVKLTQRVRVNSIGNSDGEVQIWFNEEEVLNIKGISFVSNSDKVDALYFSTFHGGADTTWSPQNDCHIWFDDIMIYTNPADAGI
jgi:hypothetical protein